MGGKTQRVAKTITYAQVMLITGLRQLILDKLPVEKRSQLNLIIEDLESANKVYGNKVNRVLIERGGELKKTQQGEYWAKPDVPKRDPADNDAVYKKKLDEYYSKITSIDNAHIKLKHLSSGEVVEPILTNDEFEEIAKLVGISIEPIREVLVLKD